MATNKGATLTEIMALVAEAMRRSIGLVVDDTYVLVGLALCQQPERFHGRRARRTLELLGPELRTRAERSAVAAFPVMYHWFRRRSVAVMVTSDADARQDALLYTKIMRELQVEDQVFAVETLEQAEILLVTQNRQLLSGQRAPVMIGTQDTLAPVIERARMSVVIVRLSPEATEQVARRRRRRTATLPDLAG